MSNVALFGASRKKPVYDVRWSILVGLFAIGLGLGVGLGGSLSCHAGLDFAELGLAGQKFLSLLVNLTLDLEFDLAQLLLLSSELLLLETDGLRSKVLGVHRTVNAAYR
jgi:hypothetical protein